jgi:hypothetical protein
MTVDKLANLTWSGFITQNLIPVTLGNIVGGAGMVGLVYWFVYLRAEPVLALPGHFWERCVAWVRSKQVTAKA